uniref:Uncharacterized protein n=1 Tax=Oryza brachyantha TaxID=4533 RepID=J3M3J2_ORYBR
MTRGGRRTLLEKQRKKRQDPVSTSTESDGENSPRVQYPRGRIGKKKADEVSPRRRGKRTTTVSALLVAFGLRNHPTLLLPPGPLAGLVTPRGQIMKLLWGSSASTPSMCTRKKSSITEMKRIDWDFMQKQTSQVAKTAIRLCHQKNIDVLMSMEHNWSEELIGQFYASAFFEDSDDYTEEKPALSQDTIRRLYVDDSNKVTLGTIKALLSHYDLLLKMIKTTLSPKSGDKTALTARHAALLWSMCTNAPPFSIMRYIWNKIQAIVLDPSKGLAYAPFLHQMIQRVTDFYFNGECVHYPYRPQIPQAPKISRSRRRPVGSSSQPVCTSSCSSSSSPIKRALSTIFGLCKKNAVKIKSNECKINQILRDSGHEIPPESEDEDYIDHFVAYEAELAARAADASSSRAPQDSDEDTEEDDEEDEGEGDDDEEDDVDDDDDDDEE